MILCLSTLSKRCSSSVNMLIWISSASFIITTPGKVDSIRKYCYFFILRITLKDEERYGFQYRQHQAGYLTATLVEAYLLTRLSKSDVGSQYLLRRSKSFEEANFYQTARMVRYLYQILYFLVLFGHHTSHKITQNILVLILGMTII